MGRGKSKQEQLWYNDIKFHFIYLSYTFKELSEKFPVCDKTIRTWAQRDGWLEEKNQYLQDRMEFSTTITRLAIAEANAILDIRKKDPLAEISQSRNYSVVRYGELAVKVYDYAKKVKEEAKEEDRKDGQDSEKGKLSQETMERIAQDLRII